MSALSKLKNAPKFDIDANCLRIAGTFCGTIDVMRKEYESVLIEPAPFGRGVYVVALDGNCICIQFDPTGSAKQSYCINVDPVMHTQLKLGRRFVFTPNSHLVVRTAGETDRAYDQEDVFVHQPAEFVKWRMALPEKWTAMKPCYPSVIRASHLHRIAALHLEGTENRAVHFLGYPTRLNTGKGQDKQELAVALFPHNSNMIVVICPAEKEVVNINEPTWLNPADPAGDL